MGEQTKRFVVFFDANMPQSMREFLKPRMPYAELVYLNGAIRESGECGIHRVSDSEVLSITLELAKAYKPLVPYLVTQDQKFREMSGYDSEKHAVTIFIIPGLTSAIFQHVIEERIINYFEGELEKHFPRPLLT